MKSNRLKNFNNAMTNKAYSISGKELFITLMLTWTIIKLPFYLPLTNNIKFKLSE
jgi:hypothetical protein